MFCFVVTSTAGSIFWGFTEDNDIGVWKYQITTGLNLGVQAKVLVGSGYEQKNGLKIAVQLYTGYALGRFKFLV